ncbi:MAG: hypothetical protein ACTSVY_11135 [Candidatus Helarchaeota archaeon]
MSDIKNNENLMDKRSYFIGDRIFFSQIACLFLTGVITFFIDLSGIGPTFASLTWWLFCILIPIACIIILGIKKLSLYFNHHWSAIFVVMLIIWLSLTVNLGVLIDSYTAPTNAFWESLFLILMYGVGYFIARFLRMLRNAFSKNVLIGIAVAISVTIITISMIFGIQVFNYGVTTKGLDPNDLFMNPALYSCQTCIFGIYIISAGIGIVISMALHYFMLFCLFDPKGLDVEEDPPNELYLKMMIGSMIITFIAWILLLVLFPPIAGGGGGSGKKRSSKSRKSSSRRRYYHRTYYYSRYRTYAHYGTKKPRDVYPPKVVDKEWGEYELDK